MATRALEKHQLKDYFDRVSKALSAQRASIELAGESTDRSTITESAILHGLAYDPKDDRFEVVAEGLDHLIVHPRDVRVDDDEGFKSVHITDDSGRQQRISLHEPVQLPSSWTG